MAGPGRRACGSLHTPETQVPPGHTPAPQPRAHLPKGALPAPSRPQPSALPGTEPPLPANPPRRPPSASAPSPTLTRPKPVSRSHPARRCRENLQASARGALAGLGPCHALGRAPVHGSTQRAPLPRRPPGPSPAPRSRPHTRGPTPSGRGSGPSTARPGRAQPPPGKKGGGTRAKRWTDAARAGGAADRAPPAPRPRRSR